MISQNEKMEVIKITNNVKLTDCIGPAYYDIFDDMEKRKHVHYWFK